MSWPSIFTVPVRGGSTPAIKRSNVLFPDPFAPRINVSPGSMSSSGTSRVVRVRS
jgi:hypothetical protein